MTARSEAHLYRCREEGRPAGHSTNQRVVGWSHYETGVMLSCEGIAFDLVEHALAVLPDKADRLYLKRVWQDRRDEGP